MQFCAKENHVIQCGSLLYFKILRKKKFSHFIQDISCSTVFFVEMHFLVHSSGSYQKVAFDQLKLLGDDGGKNIGSLI